MNRIHFEDLSPKTINGVEKVTRFLEGISGLELHRYRIYNQEYEYFYNFDIYLNGENSISVNIPLIHLLEIERKSDHVERDVVIYLLDYLVRKLLEARLILSCQKARYDMTKEGLPGCLTDRPCEVCKFHSESGCCKWDCAFDEVLRREPQAESEA